MKKGKKKKTKLFSILFLIILAALAFFVGIKYIDKLLNNLNDAKIAKNIETINKQRTYYVFLKLKPEIVLSIKDKKIEDIGCLNEECLDIYDKLDIRDKDLLIGMEELRKILYHNGIDISNGIEVKYQDLNVDLSGLSYANIIKISKEERDKLISTIINNDVLRDSATELEKKYNDNLYAQLKQDADYGEVYGCDFENGTLACYIKEEIAFYDLNTDPVNAVKDMLLTASSNMEGIERVLNKFGVETNGYTENYIFRYPIENITIDGAKYSYTFGSTYAEKLNGVNETASMRSENMTYSAKISCNEKSFKLTKLNLLDILSESNYNIIPIYVEEKGSSAYECGDAICKRHRTYYVTGACNLETNTYSSEKVEEYLICDKDKKNCKQVTLEEFENDYNPHLGYMPDLKTCDSIEDWNAETSKEACINKNDDGTYTVSIPNSIKNKITIPQTIEE